jgi:serine phosphatase RsbU (regulator of sigma subunit)
VGRDYEVVRLDARTPLSDAVREGEVVWLDNLLAVEKRYPAILEDVRSADFGAMAAIPLRDSHGELMGALGLAWSTGTDFDPVFHSSVQTVANVVAQALERATAYDTEHELVVRIQRRLLGTVLAPAGVDVATRYLPAARTAGIGGDWFDVVQRDGSFTAAIGDVAGHGVDAVTAMAQLRTAVVGLLRAGEPVGELLERVDLMLEEPDRPMSTLAIVEVSLEAGRMTYAAAGHPWMLHWRADGSVALLDQSQQPPLGAPRVPSPPASVPVAPGDVVVLYTDGLVERRGEAVTTGIQRLVDVLEATPRPATAEEVADRLLAASGLLGATGADDDVALLVLRLEG